MNSAVFEFGVRVALKMMMDLFHSLSKITYPVKNFLDSTMAVTSVIYDVITCCDG